MGKGELSSSSVCSKKKEKKRSATNDLPEEGEEYGINLQKKKVKTECRKEKTQSTSSIFGILSQNITTMSMDAIASSAVEEVGKYLFVPFKDGPLYIYRYQENIEKLKTQIEDLIAKRATTESLVEEGRNLRSEKPTAEVKRWFLRVEKILQDNSKIEVEVEKENAERLFGCCPNWYARYHLSKQAAQMADQVKELIIGQGINFTKVTVAPPTPSVERMVDDSVAFASADSVLDQIMQALDDNDTKIIGVHGMGGVGKTTLMKRLNNKFLEIKPFKPLYKVIMVTVSSNLVTNNIQDLIAKRLGFVFRDKNPNIRASELFERLKEEKKVLIILDDVWSRFELNEVGIPCGSEHEGLKVILTTQNEDICREMGTQWKTELKVLPEAESWALLKSKAGDVVESDKIQPIAKKILKSCKGLPLAIVTIGWTLKMQVDELMWNDALRALNSELATELEGVIPEVIKSITFSYDSLRDEGIKLLFLLCRLFPEDWEIDPSILLAYGIGEGCFGEFRNYQETRDKSCVFIKKLKAASLLLEGNNNPERVVMHDIVRDVAIHIASSNKYGFFVRSGLKLVEWPEIEELGRSRRISLMHNEITTLPNNPECPQLLCLVLEGNRHLTEMPSLFFENMRNLVTLDLGGTAIQRLPSSISYLTCLRVLLLCYCRRLEKISEIEGLEKLEILDLKEAPIQELPKGLTNLKHLDLRGTKSLDVSSNLISSLTRLEELYMSNSFSEWEIGDRGDGRKAHLLEVASLPHLAILHVDVQNTNCWYQDHFASLSNLTSFCIRNPCQFHETWYRGLPQSAPDRSKSIHIEGLNILRISDFVKVLLQKTEHLELSSVRSLKNILQLGASCLNSLTSLTIYRNKEMEYLINVEEGIAFPRLTSVSLFFMPKLISIWKGVVPVGSLSSLDCLRIHDCESLKYLLPAAEMHALQNLKTLSFFRCNGMKIIISDEVEEEIDIVLPQELPMPLAFSCSLRNLNVVACRNLKHLFPYRLVKNLVHLAYIIVEACNEMEEIISIDKEEAPVDESVLPMLRFIIFHDLPKLRTICKGRPIFNWPSLEDIHITACPELKGLEYLLNVEEEPPQELPMPLAFLCNLRCLDVLRCNNLKHLFPYRLVKNLVHLEDICVRECDEMEEIISIDKEEAPVDESVLPMLQYIHLSDLPKLRTICKGRPIFHLPSLEKMEVDSCPELKGLEYLLNVEEEPPQELPMPSAFLCNLHHLEVSRCNNLKHLFPYRLVKNLVHLEDIYVFECDEMEEIISIDKEEAPVDESVLPMLRCIHLIDLPKLTTICKGRPIFHLPSLEKMEVDSCPELKRPPMGSQSAPRLTELDVDEELLEGLEWEDENIKSRLSALSEETNKR